MSRVFDRITDALDVETFLVCDSAEEAKELGCGLYITGEASWGEVIAAENCGIEMICAGHYATETFGVKALARAIQSKLHLRTEFLPRSSMSSERI